jgi:DNA polymerase-4
MLFAFAHGIDTRQVEPEQERKSLGTETTYSRDLADLHAMDEELDRMGEEVAGDLRTRDLAACTVTVKVRYPDFTTVTRSRTFMIPTNRAARLAGLARALLRRTDAGRTPVRLLGLSTSTLVGLTQEQLELFEETT